MSTITPERTLVQRMDALKKGNDIRIQRANYKRQMMRTADRERSKALAVAMILEPVKEFETMKVRDLLLAIRGYGDTKVNKILQKLIISPAKTVGGLSERQRRQLVEAIRYGI